MTNRMNRARASGRFVLRLPPDLHASLREQAAERSLSLNEYCVSRLSSGGVWRDRDDVTALVERAEAIAGPALLGVVVFGSWARGHASDSSDVDALVVVGQGFELTRAAYDRWDERPVTVEGRAVDAHFVRLAQDRPRLSGLWAEAAIDGVVVFERGRTVSSWLIEVRRALVEGRLARRVVHGQPYWREVA